MLVSVCTPAQVLYSRTLTSSFKYFLSKVHSLRLPLVPTFDSTMTHRFIKKTLWSLETKYVLLQSLQKGPNAPYWPICVSVKRECNPRRRLTYLTQSKRMLAHAQMPANDHHPLKQNSYLIVPSTGNAEWGQQKLYLVKINKFILSFVCSYLMFLCLQMVILIDPRSKYQC